MRDVYIIHQQKNKRNTVNQNDLEGCKIINIRKGSIKQGREYIIYATLVSKTGETLICATLDYIVQSLNTRLKAK